MHAYEITRVKRWPKELAPKCEPQHLCNGCSHFVINCASDFFRFWQRFPLIFDTVLAKNKNNPPIGIEPYAETAWWLSSPRL